MNFLDFAAGLQIEVDKPLSALIDRVLLTCDHLTVTKRDECVHEFVMLSGWARLCVQGQDGLTLKQREQFREIRDLASKLRDKLDELGSDDWDELKHRNASGLDIEHDFSGAIAGASQRAGGRKTQREIVVEVGKRFVVLCHKYRIPVTWSKDLDSCSEYCSAWLLGAIFEAGRLSFNTDGLQRRAVDAANNCLSKLSKGFSWVLHHEDRCEYVEVNLSKIEGESFIGQLPRFRCSSSDFI